MAAAHRRRQPWVPAATGALVRAVGEHPLLPMLMSSTTAPNRDAWREVGRSMGRHGLGRTPGQLRGKWKALKVAFHAERAHRARHQAPSSHPPALYAQMWALWDRAGRPQYRDRHHTVAMAQAAAEVAAAAAAPHQPPARRRRIRQVPVDSSSSSSPSTRERASRTPPGGEQQAASPQPTRQPSPGSSASVVEVPLHRPAEPVHPVEEQEAVVAGQAETVEQDWTGPAGTTLGSPHAQQSAGASVLERAAATLAAWSEADSGAWGAAAPSSAPEASVPAHAPPLGVDWTLRATDPLVAAAGSAATAAATAAEAARATRDPARAAAAAAAAATAAARAAVLAAGASSSPGAAALAAAATAAAASATAAAEAATAATGAAPEPPRGVSPAHQQLRRRQRPRWQTLRHPCRQQCPCAAQGPRLVGRFDRLRRVVEATLGCHQVIQDQLVFLEGSARVAFRTHQALERRVAQLEANPTLEAAAAEVIRLLQAAQGQAAAHLAALMAIMAQLGIGPPPPSPPQRPSRDCPRHSAHRDAPSTSRTQQ